MFRYVLRCILICIVFLQLKTTTKKSLNCKTCACLPFQAYEIASAVPKEDGREAMWPTISHLAFALTAATQPRVVVAVQPPAFGGQPAVPAVQLWKKLANLDSCLSSKKALRRWKLHCRESRMSISLTSTPELSSRSPSWSSILLIGASTFWKRTKNEQLWSRDTHVYYILHNERYFDLNFISISFFACQIWYIAASILSNLLFRTRISQFQIGFFGLFESQTFDSATATLFETLYCWQG